jgi:hypothetical protein
MDTMTLDALVCAVAQARQQTAAAQAALSATRHAFETEHAPLFATLEAARSAEEQAECRLREAVLNMYNSTGSKRPHPAVGIRVCTRLIYDPAAVTEWAREHLTALLILDTKRFEQVAPHLMVPGVTTCTEPQATIAQDLDPWIPVVDTETTTNEG